MNKIKVFVFHTCIISSFIVNFVYISRELIGYQLSFFGNNDQTMYYETKNKLWMAQSFAMFLLVAGVFIGYPLLKRNRKFAIFFWVVVVLLLLNSIGNVLYLKDVLTYEMI
ncbi:hypothetical protein [Paenibacillus sp. V4I5]|uniref:hypothetical protein n=1 Tax=Paenibacillus sp. V4I5 TaxID=3042306 RepID=UPI0027903383|nr:hypothetical protein [Paenibacillus sp. V4I5]MDQ0913867.1 hypothetical protein [Paenibacillus sp. V4I5]